MPSFVRVLHAAITRCLTRPLVCSLAMVVCCAAPSVWAGGFTLSMASERVVVMQGGRASIAVRVERQAGFDGEIVLQLGGLPPGVSAPRVTLAAKVSEATVELQATEGAPHSLPTRVTVQGHARIGNQPPLRSERAFDLTVRGPAGSADTSFANGRYFTRVGARGDYAHAVAVQADGKVLVAGSTEEGGAWRIAVVRHLRDGGLDAGFGSGGKAIVAVGSRDDKALAIAVQADGRIVVAGVSQQGAPRGYDFAVVRLLPDGRPDPAFGDNGRALADFGGDNDRAHALLLPDGRIVAGGQTNRTRGSGLDFALAAFTPDGRPDAGFGDHGQVATAVLPASTGDVVRGLALQTVEGQPHIVAVGGEGDFTVARYSLQGVLDGRFGQRGTTSGLFGTSIGSAFAVTVLPGGELVLAGHIGHDFAAVQLSPAGKLDTRFGPARDGRFRHAVAEANWDEATALVRQADGRLLLGGWAFSGVGTSGDFAALQLNADGTLDSSFGQGGVARHALATQDKTDLGRAMALQADERVPTVRALLAGEAQDIDRDFALLRIWL